MSISPNHLGRCPHCGVEQRFEPVLARPLDGAYFDITTLLLVSPGVTSRAPDRDSDSLLFGAAACANCRKISIQIRPELSAGEWDIAWPRSVLARLPQEVQDENPDLAGSIREATEILDISPMASAALSRRALDDILMDKVGAPKGTLDSKIEFAASRLPTELAEDLNYVREVGNFGLHRKKSEATGEILKVEPGEAEYTLEVVLKLVDHCYVRPVREQRWRDGMKAKLADAKRDS